MIAFNPSTERRLFQIIVLVATIVPIAGGIAGALIGPRMLHGVTSASPDLESHFRYLSGLLFGIGLAFAACAARLDRLATLYRSLSLIVILGGLARLLGLVGHGSPTGANRLAFLMELVVVPLLLIWLDRIQRRESEEEKLTERLAAGTGGKLPLRTAVGYPIMGPTHGSVTTGAEREPATRMAVSLQSVTLGVNVKIELNCAQCGQNSFNLEQGLADHAVVSCDDCGHRIGTIGELKERVAAEVLKRSAAHRFDG